MMFNSNSINSSNNLTTLLDLVGKYQGIKYNVVKEIGRGTYGNVYECLDTSTNQHVAIKAVEHKYANNELKAFNRLRNVDGKISNLIELLRCFTNDTLAILVYPIYGPNLREAIAFNKQPFNLQEVRVMAKQLIKATNFLHKNGMIHSDIKPDNILLNRLVN